MSFYREINLAMLSVVANALGHLKEQVVFLGGCTTGLFITDTTSGDVRSTMDVDLIVEAGVIHEFHAIESAMRKLGFKPDVKSGMRCRWVVNDILVDLMPTDASILGFSNRWYSDAIIHAVDKTLTDGQQIKCVTAPYFLATKIEAFHGRGNSDFVASHDFEDIVTVIDGREELYAEIADSSPELRDFISNTFQTWVEHADFFIDLTCHLPPDPDSQKRFPILKRRILALASIR